MARNLYILKNVQINKDLGILSPGILSQETFIVSGSKINGNVYNSDFGISESLQITSPSLLKSGTVIAFGSSITISPSFKHILQEETYIDVTEFGNITKHPEFHKLAEKYSEMVKEKDLISGKIDTIDDTVREISNSFNVKRDEYQQRIKTLQEKNMNLVMEKDIDKEEISKLVESEKYLIDETEKFKNILLSKKCEIESLEKNLQDLEKGFSALASSKGDGKALVGKLKSLFSKLHGSSLTISNIDSIKESIESMVKRSDADIDFSKQTINELGDVLPSKYEELDNLRETLSESEKDKTMLLEIISNMIDDYQKSSLESSVKINEQNKTLKLEKERALSAISQLIQTDYELRDLKSKFNCLVEENKSKSNEVDEMRELLLSIGDDNIKLKDMLECERKVSANAKHIEEINSVLENTVISLESKISELEKQLHESLVDSEQLGKENNTLKTKILEVELSERKILEIETVLKCKEEEVQNLLTNLEEMAFSHQLETNEREAKEKILCQIKKDLEISSLKIKDLETLISSSRNNNDDDINEMVSLIKELSDKVRCDKVELSHKDKEIESLKSENEHLSNNLLETLSKLEIVTEKSSNYENLITEIDTKVTEISEIETTIEVKEKVSILARLYSERTKNVNDLTENNQRMIEEVSSYKEKLSEYESSERSGAYEQSERLCCLEKELVELRLENSFLKMDKENLENKVKELQIYIESLVLTSESNNKEKDNLNEVIKRLENTITSLQHENENLTTIFSEKDSGKLILSLNEKISSLNDKNLKLSSDILTALDGVGFLESKITDAGNKILELIDERDNLSNLNKDYSNVIDTLTEEKQELLKIIEKLNKQICSSRPKCHDNDSYESLDVANEDMTVTRISNSDQAEVDKAVVKHQKQKIKSLEGDLEMLCGEYEKLENELKAIKENFAVEHENNKFLEMKIIDLTELLTSFHNKYENIIKFDFPCKIQTRINKLIEIESEMGKMALSYKNGKLSVPDFIKRGEELESDKKKINSEIEELLNHLLTCLKM